MPLNDLTLEALTQLSGTLGQIEDSGRQLAAYGLNPVFDLTPGQPMRITLDAVMPEVSALSDRDQFLEIQAAMEDSWRRGTTRPMHLWPTAPTEAAPPEPALDPVDAPLVPGEVTEGAPISADAQSSSDDAAAPPPTAPEASPPPLAKAASPEGEAESGGGQVVAAAEPPAAPVPGSASALAASTLNSFGQSAWTEAEDTRLVALVVAGIVGLGLTKTAAMRAAAEELARPEAGTAFRCHTKLKARLADALAAAQAAKAEAEELLAVQRDIERADRPAFIVAHGSEATLPPDLDARSREAAIAHGNLYPAEPVLDRPASFIADPVTAWLMGLTDKGGWTLDRDLELMELSIAGWAPNEIALQLQMQANAIKPRFDTLTGLYQDDDGKKARRFTREDVYAALQRLAGKAA